MTRSILSTGERFDIGGYQLNLHHIGSGSPAVIFDTGLGTTSLLWAQVLPLVGAFATACAFDRAGYGSSDPAPDSLPRTSQQIVEELRILLQKATIAPPYILVGHSFGAINMTWYALNYSSEVAGLVLVDPSHPQMFERVQGIPSSKSMIRGMRVVATLSRWGVLKPFAPLLARGVFPHLNRFPPELRSALIDMSSQTKNFVAALREAEASDESFRSAVSVPGDLGDLPLVVLTAEWWVTGRQTAMKCGIAALRGEQAQLSTRGEHLIISGCDHSDLPILRADAVVDAVKKVKDWK